MTYYDQTFEPWEIVDGQSNLDPSAVVADEAEWQKLLEWDLLRSKFPKGDRTIVKIITDIFEDVKGGVVDSEFRHMFDLESESVRPRDILTRTFQTVDATPHVDYLLMTQRPELVRKGWIGCERDHNKDGDCDRHKNGCPKSNVILAVPVETQADIERLVPNLLKCHDLCKGLAVVCNPKEKLHVEPYLTRSYEPTEDYAELQGIDLIIAEGNEHPMHPDWLRLLRDQCKDVVPFHFARWGDWVPIGDFGKANSWTRTQIDPVLKGSINGEFAGEYETLYPWPETCNNPCMIRGYQRSGRLLDGQEHNGRVS